VRIEGLTIGDELLDGAVPDGNAAWLGRALDALDHSVSARLTVRDDIDAIADALRTITARADLCIVTGGLGPTDDDLTVDGLCRAAGVDFEFDAAAWARIEARYGDRAIPVSNRRQARRPVGGALLVNEVGTASAVELTIGTCHVICLPGVPREARWLFERHVAPQLPTPANANQLRIIRFALIGESTLAERIEALDLPTDVDVGWRACGPVNEIKLRGLAAVIDPLADRIRAALPTDHLGGHPTLAHATIAAACKAGLTVGTAESCTGGLVGAALTDVPGASVAFAGGIISYANAVKMRQLGVSESILKTHGAVSEACARAMAEGARAALDVDVAVAITGIAGPGGGTPSKPVGTVWFAWSGAGLDATRCVHIKGDRDRVRAFAVAHALDPIRRGLAATQRTLAGQRASTAQGESHGPR
jgi:nicotinamide-nucleotide amidase